MRLGADGIRDPLFLPRTTSHSESVPLQRASKGSRSQVFQGQLLRGCSYPSSFLRLLSSFLLHESPDFFRTDSGRKIAGLLLLLAPHSRRCGGTQVSTIYNTFAYLIKHRYYHHCYHHHHHLHHLHHYSYIHETHRRWNTRTASERTQRPSSGNCVSYADSRTLITACRRLSAASAPSSSRSLPSPKSLFAAACVCASAAHEPSAAAHEPSLAVRGAGAGAADVVVRTEVSHRDGSRLRLTSLRLPAPPPGPKLSPPLSPSSLCSPPPAPPPLVAHSVVREHILQ